MAWECIRSDLIMDREAKSAFKRVPRAEGATHHCIERRRFKQYRVNPSPKEGMKSFPQDCREVVIEADGHKGNVDYTVNYR